MFGGVAASAATTGSSVLDVTDTRADLMSTEKIVDEGAVDRYDFIKNAYTQHREYLIHDGNPPESSDDLLADDPSVSDNDTGVAIVQPNDTSNDNIISNTLPTKAGDVPVINNSKTLPRAENAPVPIINNSKHFLELSAPD